MNEPTDWTSAIAILVGGLVLGALIVYFFNRRKTAVIVPDLERKDLEAKRDALVAQLRALDEENVEERTRLETETAEVLRRLDQAPQARQAEVAPVSTGMSPTIKGFLWGAGSVAALAGLAWFVMNQSTPRQEGGTVTGNTPMMQQPQQAAPQASPVVLQLEAAVRNDPNNLQLRNDLAQAYLETDNLPAVLEQTRYVLDKSPNDSRALTFQALVLMSRGQSEEAMQMLERATQSNPNHLDAWVARAWAYVQQNRISDAEKMIAQAKNVSPKDTARLDEVFSQMKMQASGNVLPAGHPPIDDAPAAAASAPADGKSVTITLELDPAAAQKSGILYVIARNPMGGPPAAVKRLQVTSFPVTLQLSAADSMMGQPFPDKFRLEARLDSDGDVATKPPTDPSAMQNDVVPGATVTLALK